MDLSRREFLRAAGAASVTGVLFAGCAIPERELIKQSPRDLPEDLAGGLEDWYATSCAFCGDAHGIIVRVVEGRAKKIEGNPDHPVNRGGLMARCLMGVQSHYHPDRLNGPQRADGSSVSWDIATAELSGAISEAGAGRTVIITAPQRGHLGYVVKEFAAAIGAQHMVLEPLEQTTVRAATQQVFGQPRIPHFDIANAKSVLSIGADFLESWLSPVSYNNAYGQFRQGRDDRGVLIHADSRFSMTAANADTWLPVKAGQEGTLALSIAYALIEDGLVDAAVADRMTGGQGVAALGSVAPELVANLVSSTEGVVTAEKIREVAHTLADNQPALVIAGGNAAAQTNGLFNVSAALALNELLGSVGIEGGVRFNPEPPVPNLQQLTPPATLAQWKALKSRLDSNEIGLILVQGADPAHALETIGFRDALRGTSARIISFANVLDETATLAGLILPDRSYLESWGTDVPEPGPGYPVLTIQQPVVPPLIDRDGNLVHDSRGFGDLLLSTGLGTGSTLGQSLGVASMEALVRRELETLYDTHPNGGSVRGASFEAFRVGVLQRGGWWDTAAFSSDTGATATLPAWADETEARHFGSTGADTYLLVPFVTVGTGDGSSAALPWGQSTPDPITSVTWITWVEVNSRVAHERGLQVGDVVRLEGPGGSVELPVYIHPGIPPGVVSVPFGRGHEASGRYAENRGENVLKVLTDQEVDGVGASAWATTRVKMSGTGRRVRVPRMEGGFTGSQLEDAPVIQLTTG